MAGFPSGMYGIEKRNWMRIWLGVVVGLLAVIVLIGAYYLLHRVMPAEARAAVKDGSDSGGLYGAGAPDANSQAANLINQVLSNLNANPAGIIEARDRLNDILLMSLGAQQRRFVKEELSKLADEWLFSSKVYPGDKLCDSYEVAGGDNLTRIGRQHKVPYEILMEINKMAKPQQLRVDEKIKVVDGPFRVKVYRSMFMLDLYLQNVFVRSFKVGLGKTSRETPTGLWVVKSDGKLVAPKWTDPDTGKTYKSDDPDYPLGSRWIALKGVSGAAVNRAGFAIHGTKDPNQIGKAESRGCIRMFNGDAVLMYNLLAPGQSQVEVVD